MAAIHEQSEQIGHADGFGAGFQHPAVARALRDVAASGELFQQVAKFVVAQLDVAAELLGFQAFALALCLGEQGEDA